jgi:hypothetical protein
MGVENLIPGVAQAKELLHNRAVRMGAGVLAVASITGLGMAAGVVHTQETVSVDGGSGELKDVRAITPEECLSAYTSEIKGARANFHTTLEVGPFSIPTTFDDQEEYNGTLTSKVCTHPKDYLVHVDTQKRSATAQIPASAFTTTVYAENPVKDDVHTVSNGIAMVALKNVTNIIKVIPNVNFEGKTDDLVGNLRALAFLGAQSTQAEACGKTAWPYLKPIETKQLQESLAKNIEVQEPFISKGQPQLKPEEINVVLPETITFTTQYTDKLKAAEQEMKANGVTFEKPASGVVCKPSKQLKVTAPAQ